VRKAKWSGGTLGIEFTRFSKMTSQNPIQFLSPSFLGASRLEKEDKNKFKSYHSQDQDHRGIREAYS
jgi:hypothetical protein